MDELICASLSHTHYRYEVSMLKVPAVLLCMYIICMYGQKYIKRTDQPGNVANPARGQLNR